MLKVSLYKGIFTIGILDHFEHIDRLLSLLDLQHMLRVCLHLILVKFEKYGTLSINHIIQTGEKG